MRVLVMTAPWELRVEERDDPEPSGHEVVVRIEATGICGSDFHGFTGTTGRRQAGQIMGHETVGYVEAVGPDVDDLPLGTLVTVNPVLSCDRCDVCARGDEQSCPHRTVIGVAPEVSAAFAEKMLVRRSNVVPLDPSLNPEIGALVEPLAVGYHAASRGGCGPDDKVLIVGGGPIGQACLLACRRLGATSVVVSDVKPERRRLCETLGARTVDPAAGDLAAQVAEALGGAATLAIDAVGLTPTLRDALTASELAARVVLVGMGAQQVEIPAYAVSTGERTIIGSFCYSRRDFADTARWVGETDVDLSQLVDGRVGLEDAEAAFTALARGTTADSKILVFPHGVPTGAGGR